jgi:hypothetical protein
MITARSGEASSDGSGELMTQGQFKPGNQLKVTFEISLSGRLFTGFSQNGHTLRIHGPQQADGAPPP